MYHYEKVYFSVTSFLQNIPREHPVIVKTVQIFYWGNVTITDRLIMIIKTNRTTAVPINASRCKSVEYPISNTILPFFQVISVIRPPGLPAEKADRRI